MLAIHSKDQILEVGFATIDRLPLELDQPIGVVGNKSTVTSDIVECAWSADRRGHSARSRTAKFEFLRW